MTFAWKEGTRFSANVETIAKEIESIGTEVTPAQIVKKAKSAKTALHQCFDWDDTEAAGNWRLQQARLIVNSIVVYEEPEETEAPTFVCRAYESVTVDRDTGGRAYVAVRDAMNNKDWRAEVFAGISSGIYALENKAESYEHMYPDLKKTASDLRKAREGMKG